MKRFITVATIAAMLLTGLAAAAFGAHESENRIDLKPTSGNTNGGGYSTFVPKYKAWNSAIRVRGLTPKTLYTFYAEGTVDNLPSQTPICVFRTGRLGGGYCAAIRHAEPALAVATIRLGNGNPLGEVVLEARGSTDKDCRLENGEIERHPPCG